MHIWLIAESIKHRESSAIDSMILLVYINSRGDMHNNNADQQNNIDCTHECMCQTMTLTTECNQMREIADGLDTRIYHNNDMVAID